jgi:RHS repeat-associated protein
VRDNAGQDYADQRYYNVGAGRFNVPDALGINAAKLQNPATWNRYAYTLGDPVNSGDPTGRVSSPLCFLSINPVDCPTEDPCDPVRYENGFAPAPDPACTVDPPPPPTLGWGDSSCTISVAMGQGATPRDGQNAVGQSDYSPTKNELGQYTNSQGWFYQVQIQVNLIGDTDPSHWTIGQSASYSGSITLSNGVTMPWNQSSQPDGPNLPSVIDRAHTGHINWLDNPGMPRYPFGSVRGFDVVGGDVTFNFYSWAWHGDTSCSVKWSLHWKNGRFQ